MRSVYFTPLLVAALVCSSSVSAYNPRVHGGMTRAAMAKIEFSQTICELFNIDTEECPSILLAGWKMKVKINHDDTVNVFNTDPELKRQRIEKWVIHGVDAEDEAVDDLKDPDHGSWATLASIGLRSTNHFYNPFYKSESLYPYGRSRADVSKQLGGLVDYLGLGRGIQNRGIPSAIWGARDTGALGALSNYGRDICLGNPCDNACACGFPPACFFSDLRCDQRPQTRTAASNSWSWDLAKEHYTSALKGKAPEEVDLTVEHSREWQLAATLRSLGQMVHLIQDAAMPDHVRNDAHPTQPNLDYWADKYYSGSFMLEGLPVDPYRLVTRDGEDPYRQFLDSYPYGEDFKAGSSLGIAEFTAYNFASRDTFFDQQFDLFQQHGDARPWHARRIFTSPLATGTVELPLPSSLPEEDSLTVLLGDNIVDPLGVVTNTRRLIGLIDDGEEVEIDKVPILAEKARILIPRGGWYSAAMLEYFFRGRFKIDSVNLNTHLEIQFHNASYRSNDDKEIEGMENGTLELWWKRVIYPPEGPPTAEMVQLGIVDDEGSDFTALDDQVQTIRVYEALSAEITATMEENGEALSEQEFSLVYEGKLGLENDGVAGLVFNPPVVTVWPTDGRFIYPTDGKGMPLLEEPIDTGGIIGRLAADPEANAIWYSYIVGSKIYRLAPSMDEDDGWMVSEFQFPDSIFDLAFDEVEKNLIVMVPTRNPNGEVTARTLYRVHYDSSQHAIVSTQESTPIPHGAVVSRLTVNPNSGELWGYVSPHLEDQTHWGLWNLDHGIVCCDYRETNILFPRFLTIDPGNDSLWTSTGLYSSALPHRVLHFSEQGEKLLELNVRYDPAGNYIGRALGTAVPDDAQNIWIQQDRGWFKYSQTGDFLGGINLSPFSPRDLDLDPYQSALWGLTYWGDGQGSYLDVRKWSSDDFDSMLEEFRIPIEQLYTKQRLAVTRGEAQFLRADPLPSTNLTRTFAPPLDTLEDAALFNERLEIIEELMSAAEAEELPLEEWLLQEGLLEEYKDIGLVTGP